MFDLLITYFNFLILSIKVIVKFLAFRPPNPKGVRIINKEKKDEKNNNNINNNENKEIEILYSVPVKKENENNNKNVNNNNNNNVNNANQTNNQNQKNQEDKSKEKRKFEYKIASNKYAEFELLYLESKETGIKIPAFLFKPKDFYQYDCIIIYCHGNSGDIGTSFLECQILSRNLRCDVLSFEYPGYGLSNDFGNTNEKRAYIYIRQVYKYARDQLKFKPQNIIIYGFSLGTGIAFDLACDKRYPNGGVILQSPFLSIIRIFYNFKKTYYFDLFNSCDKAKYCESTIYIIHGNKDTIVPYVHGRILAKLIPRKHLYGFYTVNNANHNDLIKFAKENLYFNIGAFIYEMLNKYKFVFDDFNIKEKDKEETRVKEKEEDRESSVMDISSIKSNIKIDSTNKKGNKEFNIKVEVDNINNGNISSKEKLNDDNNINNKSIKSNKELKHELSNIFPNVEDNDTMLDGATKNLDTNDVAITIKKKRTNGN